MNAVFRPSTLKGRVTAPPSKSVTHRALICGAFTSGANISGIELSRDVNATLGGLKSLGAEVRYENGKAFVGGLKIPAGGTSVDCDESGSTLRFLIPIALLSPFATVFTGSKRLMERPLEVYSLLCRERGLVFEQTGGSLRVCGALSGGRFVIPGDISSQFISGLLMALPLCGEKSEIAVTGRFESRPYAEITRAVMSGFGVETAESGNTFFVSSSEYKRSAGFEVEGDFSNAAFLECFNYLGGDVKVDGLPDFSVSAQGDKVYRQMFASLAAGEREFDLSDCPDLAPVMFAMAAALGGANFKGTSRLRLKESDRSSCMALELKQFGAAAEISPDSVKIVSGGLKPPSEPLCGHNDHRVVMALAALCTVTGGEISGIEAVNKSFPGYFEKIRSIGAQFDITGQ